MKSIYNIYKSILDDIDIQMNKGDEIIKNFKKAEKDWKKLLSKTTGKSTGQFYVVSIKSPELAEYLASESSVFRYYKYEYEHKTGIKWPYDIDQVSIIYDIVHVFTSRDGMPRYVQINVDTDSNITYDIYLNDENPENATVLVGKIKDAGPYQDICLFYIPYEHTRGFTYDDIISRDGTRK